MLEELWRGNVVTGYRAGDFSREGMLSIVYRGAWNLERQIPQAPSDIYLDSSRLPPSVSDLPQRGSPLHNSPHRTSAAWKLTP